MAIGFSRHIPFVKSIWLLFFFSFFFFLHVVGGGVGKRFCTHSLFSCCLCILFEIIQ